MKIFFYSAFSIIFFQNNAYAYLDPGTGSAIIAAIISSIAISILYLKHYTKKIFDFLINLFKKKEENKKQNRDNDR
tara:strand:- start:39 stop:266 length:228 start_codon:yes stop_codon:yes gene_type:complete